MDPTLRTIIYRFKSGWQAAKPGLTRMAISLAIGFAPLVLIQNGMADALEPVLLRAWFDVRGKRSVPTSVSIVRLDKPAYAKINLSPGELFPRRVMADGLRKIAAAGAKLIVIDGVAQRPADDPQADIDLAAALQATPTVIARATEVVVDNDIYGNQVRRKVQNRSLELFEKSAKAVIQTHVRLTGGVVREISLSNDRDVFSAARVQLLEPLRTFISPSIPEPGGFDFINFYGPPGSLPTISFADLIGEGRPVPERHFRDRVVFIGAQSDSGSGVEAGKDSFLTSASSEWMFGVEIHATIAANLVDQSYIRRISHPVEGLGHALVAFGAAQIILTLSMFAGVLCALSFLVIWSLLSYFCFAKFFVFLPAVVICGAVLTALIVRWGLAAFSRR